MSKVGQSLLKGAEEALLYVKDIKTESNKKHIVKVVQTQKEKII